MENNCKGYLGNSHSAIYIIRCSENLRRVARVFLIPLVNFTQKQGKYVGGLIFLNYLCIRKVPNDVIETIILYFKEANIF